MSGIFLPTGQTTPKGLYLGTTSVKNVYLGASQVWSATPPIAFDAVGTPYAGTATATTGTCTHSAAAGAHVFGFLCVAGTATLSGISYGGTAMTLLGSVALNNITTASGGRLYGYHLASAASGSKSVVATMSAAAFFTFNTVSYTNVTTVGTPATVFGQSTSPSQAATLGGAGLLLQAFGASSGFTSSSGGTSRYLYTGGFEGLSIQDSASSTTFGVAQSASRVWAGMNIALS